jgi:hypothetical protein
MLGLAAMAAMVAMAFVGASSASANSETVVLCKSAELTCENAFPNPTTIVGHAENPKLLSSIGTVECEKSLAELELLNTLSALGVGHITALKFEGNCHLGGTSCTVTVNPLGLISFVKTGALTASATSTGGTEANVKCGFFINCTYGGEPSLEVHSSGEGATHMLANATKLTKSKGICPSTSEWDADYLALGTMYIES